MAWLDDGPADDGDEPADDPERGRRRIGAALVLIGFAVVATAVAALVLFTHRGHDTPVGHRGKQQATFRSADGKIEAAIYSITGFFEFGSVTEVVLRPAGATADRDMVSFGCTEDHDGLNIVAVTVLPDSIIARNSKGAELTIHFDPQTLRPDTTLGSC